MSESTITDKTPAWESMRCKNHPNLRWTRKSRAQQATAISRNIHLMFRGDVTNPDGEVHPFFVSEQQLRDMIARQNAAPDVEVVRDADAEVQRHLDEGYVFECACPYGDLEFMADVTDGEVAS